ncbi:MAG TPA: hypothetical protein VFW87_06850, partial [Pirellulales bacterium]|nr:hypothetical protein [Pirellulales bacterium]
RKNARPAEPNVHAAQERSRSLADASRLKVVSKGDSPNSMKRIRLRLEAILQNSPIPERRQACPQPT